MSIKQRYAKSLLVPSLAQRDSPDFFEDVDHFFNDNFNRVINSSQEKKSIGGLNRHHPNLKPERQSEDKMINQDLLSFIS